MQPTIGFTHFLAARAGKAPLPEWVVMLVLGLSVFLAATAVYLGIRVKKHLANAIYSEGEVVGFIEQSKGRRGQSVAPVIRFTESDGTSHVVNSSTYSDPPAFELGDKIRIAYSPGRPHEAEYVGLFARWGHAMILGGFAGMVAVMCLLRLYFRGAA